MSDRWDKVKALFQQALGEPPEQRRAWLERACGGDVALVQEVETLLQSLDTAGDFLERPANVGLDVGAGFTPGTVVGPYRILDELGRGGMGVVYLAEDTRLGRRVALKALPAEVAANEELRRRLRREARAAATISHPSIATIYALDEIDDHLFIVSEHVDGETLRARLSRGALEPSRVRDIALAITRALGAAHDAGVVHRDLKPENVLLTAGGDVKVVDFGIAHVEGPEITRLTKAGALLGTPAYMAPEQLLGSPVDGRADIYALGVVISEMLTGQHPLQPGARAATLPPPFASIVARCLQADPSDRYASARELAEALSRTGTLPGSPTPIEQEPVPAPVRSPQWWWEFHQAAVAFVYGVMVIPAWEARGLIGGAAGRAFFFVTLAAVVVAACLRLNLWFTARFYPSQLRWARRRVGRWIRAADWVFVIALVVAGLAIGEDRSPIAVLLIAVGIGAAVAFLVIERVTARAAFLDRRTGATS